MNHLKEKGPFFTLFLFSSAFILYFYGNILVHPDSYLFSAEGDGLKNYFTYAWHIRHDASLVNFSGMNYPYGEHFLYTDCHPILADMLKLLSIPFETISTHSIGILNFLMILSIFLTFFMIYLLLREFTIGKWGSVLFSIGITLLAPQLFRMSGHLSLSYSLAIPFSWYLIIKYLKGSHQFRIFCLLILNGLFWLLIHAYLGAMIILFQGMILIIMLLGEWRNRKKLYFFLKSLGIAILPLLIFYLFAFFTDTHNGRTDHPSGFFLYNAEPDDIFVPHHPPLRPWLDSLSGNSINLQWEAWSYIGLSSMLLLFTILLMAAGSIFSKKSHTFLKGAFNNRLLNVSLLSALFLLLFSMAVPFKQFPSLLDIFPVIKQFRATGRFAWPFFFTITIFAAKVFHFLYSESRSPLHRTTFLLIFIIAGIAQVLEGFPYHISTASSLSRTSNFFRPEFIPRPMKSALSHTDPSKYQAILSLPFFYQGSESFSRTATGNDARLSMMMAYQTGLPLVNTVLTRTSVLESKNIIQMVGPSFYPKPIREDIRDNRPFLLLKTSEALSPFESELLSKARVIYSDRMLSLYSLEMEDLFRNDALKYFKAYTDKRSQLNPLKGFMVSNDSSRLFYNSYEKSPSPYAFRGKGSYQGLKKGRNVLADFEPGTFIQGEEYEVSVWMYNGNKDALNLWFRFMIEQEDINNGTVTTSVFFPELAEAINGNWSMVEAPFTVHSKNSRVTLLTMGKDDARGPFYADDLLIRQKNTDVYRLSPGDSLLFFNNHEIRAN